jgi:hypothetical protein
MIGVVVVFSCKSPQNSLGVVVAVLCALVVAGCGSNQTIPQVARPTMPPVSADHLDPHTVEDIVALIGRIGLAVPNPRDVSVQQCPKIGCIHKVDTDTISLMKFASPGTAQLYAGVTQHRFQVADVVMTFSPTMTHNEQLKYEVAVKGVVE